MNRASPASAGFIRLYTLAFLFFFANSVLTVALPLRSADAGLGQGGIGLMMGAYMLTCMLLRPLAGQWIGRFGPLAVMRGLLVVHAITLLLYAVSGIEGYIWLRALQGAATAFFSMTMQAGIMERLDDKDRGQGLSLYTLSTMLPSLVGPLLAVELWERGGSFAFGGAMLLLAFAAIAAGLSLPLPKASAHKQSYTLRGLIDSFGEIGRSRPLGVSTFIMLLTSCIFGAIATFLPLYLISTNSGNVGIYLALQGATVVVCRFVFRKKIPSDGRWSAALILGLLLASAVGTQMLAVPQMLGSLVYLSAVFNGLALAFLYPTLTTYLSFALPNQARYTLMGLFMSSYDLGFALGGLVFGWIAQISSYPTVFTCCTLLALIAFIVAALNGKKMHPKITGPKPS
ncbi:staphylopine family metallophore export MFS transporter CntE [Saccharibacillus endophyticus]|uniref:MFS transporter n=1 Tax=Saccharibacillus endophyticus TaxID=2060666 RepID=A0ABQ1ZRH1_9BACL|nr:MFS transporter [Saccharibacillus endophyticus]GGH72862.1 MFS transporter [Saccharibacillus endophyticus]